SLQAIIERDLLGSAHQIDGERKNDRSDGGNEMEHVPRAQAARAIARGLGVEIQDRTVQPWHRVRDAKEVRVRRQEARRVVNRPEQMDCEGDDQRGEEPVRRSIRLVRRESAGQEKSLNGADERGDAYPVEVQRSTPPPVTVAIRS